MTSCKETIEPDPDGGVVVQPGDALAIKDDINVKTTLVDRIQDPNLPDYIVAENFNINHELTINPGVVIAFERDVRVNINDDGGVIIAKGTAEKKIRLVGVQKTKGYWTGIVLYSGSNANVMEHVEIMHACSRPTYSDIKSALFIPGSSGAQIALNNCLFSQNEGYGIYIYEGATLRQFSQNTFSNNTEAGILIDAMNVSKLDPASKFTGGNGRDVVEVTPSGMEDKAEIVWKGFEDKTPYLISGDFAVSSGWKINPGVTLKMDRDAVIRINSEGYIMAKGTATQKVVFTSANGAPAYWRGIICYSSDNSNTLEHAEVRNAGGNTIVSGKKANVAVYGNGSALTIKNTVISGSGGHGVFVSYGSSVNDDLTTTNVFESNAQTNVLIEE
ncbi:right-handed parallel beta-helix repeat-containing protein [Telluribacter humicola]|uniref:right-handed parallel beta-helix repeat-containing protein n=1 Tax=Telluribacter humicola TaxID=1720261 RepID=UPI001E4DC4F1|nr:right-handed parallel beta-helix repeat-containing protein [Telluribacter humicola]